ncbi:amino acid permease GAP1 [Sugiyamaella lignohabitans]|uniref:Amino acid permease GAP1 n=1 Tax=Sugiyamaella lignohabitans TaxID=796027 RepID=A0A170QZ38_9ASCO|nr:amino acid permease GAP1 [Sugiyamaella lignohabitans]ANB16001.1 amino acid permease GAP1 [Sugiyamaella lignohabitans]
MSGEDDLKNHFSNEDFGKHVSGAGSVERVELSRWQRIKDSFKEADLSGIDTTNMTDVEKAAIATANSPLQRSLKGRHLQMIAIGGSIGTGLFVGSGKVLAVGGPA